MLIRDVTITPLLAADPPLLNVIGVHQPYVPRVIVEIVTDDGVLGLGETYGDAHILDWLSSAAEVLRGTSIFELNRLQGRVAGALDGTAAGVTGGMKAHHGINITGAVSLSRATAIVQSVFEVAMLDAQGHTLGLPVHALLGGKVRDRVDFSGYLFYKWAEHPFGEGEPDDWGEILGPDAVVREAQRMVDRYGFRSLKLKGGVMDPDAEIEAIRALHRAFPEHALRIDPNAGWSVETSLRVAAELDGMLEYFEDPTPAQHMSEVASRIGVPLATNMCVMDFSHIPEAIATKSVSIILSDHHFWGGLRASQRLAAICDTWGLSLSMHSNSHLGVSLAAMTHLAATVPAIAYACDTHWPWQTEDVVVGEPLPIIDGAIAVPDSPGLGVELDREALARLHERWLASDVRIRDDEGAMRRVRPDWNPVLPRF